MYLKLIWRWELLHFSLFSDFHFSSFPLGENTTNTTTTTMSDGKVTIGYWKIRGLAAPLRMIMVHAGAEFEDKQYAVTGEPGNWDTSSWYVFFFFFFFSFFSCSCHSSSSSSCPSPPPPPPPPFSPPLLRFKTDKPGLVEKNALMNLPYIVDGDNVVTQSNACLTYLGRKYNLNGKTETEIIKNDQV